MSKLRRMGRRLGGHFWKIADTLPDQVLPTNVKIVTPDEITKFIGDLADMGTYENEFGDPIFASTDCVANARSWVANRFNGDENRAAAFWMWAQDKAQISLHGHLQSPAERYPLMFGNQAN